MYQLAEWVSVDILVLPKGEVERTKGGLTPVTLSIALPTAVPEECEEI